MKKTIHRYNWNEYSYRQARNEFEKEFGTIDHPLPSGSYVTCLPGPELFDQLRSIETALLECLENRTSSTVYRVKGFQLVYQVKESPPNAEFANYDQFMATPLTDQLLNQYSGSTDTFSVESKGNGALLVTRNKEPRFSGLYYPENNDISTTGEVSLVNESWADPEPDPESKKKIMRKLGLFLSKYTKS